MIRQCLRCGTDLADLTGVNVFVDSLPVPALMCIDHGANGANSLTAEQWEQLTRQSRQAPPGQWTPQGCPTPLPERGQVWELANYPSDPALPPLPLRVVVIERTDEPWWHLRVAFKVAGLWKRREWVYGCVYLAEGWLRYIGPAGPNTRTELHLDWKAKR